MGVQIDEDMYLIFQSAITGRSSLESIDDQGVVTEKSFSLMDMEPTSAEENQRIRKTIASDGFILNIFDLLRRVQKRLLMILKLK